MTVTTLYLKSKFLLEAAKICFLEIQQLLLTHIIFEAINR